MKRVFIPIEFETDELLEEAMEIQRLAGELGEKVYRFRLRTRVTEDGSSPTEEEPER